LSFISIPTFRAVFENYGRRIFDQAINHHLEQIAQAIFKSWFVDFEPFGGVMPDDWREGTLSEIATVTMGQSPEGIRCYGGLSQSSKTQAVYHFAA
jgi:hypothetical protein